MRRPPAEPPRLLERSTSGPSRRSYVALLAATGTASMLDSSAIIAVGLGLPLWRTAYGLDVWATGAIAASLTLAIAVGALVGGRVADVLGRTRVYPATVLLYATGALIVTVAPAAPWLVGGVLVVGLASGADLPASLAVLTERAPVAVRGRLVATTHVLWTVGVVATSAAGLAVSGSGVTGIRVLFAVLAVLALTTAALRASYAPGTATSAPIAARPAPLPHLLRDRRVLMPLLLTGTYYALYTLVANTFGNFKTYFLVVVGGATQTTATTISFATGLVGLAGTIVFAYAADSRWRARLFPVGIAGYVVALTLIAVTSGTLLPVTVIAIVLQNLSFPFVGDALYKVWTQELFAADIRASAMGVSIFVARSGAALFALVTPAAMSWSPTVLFLVLLVVILGVCATGVRISRH